MRSFIFIPFALLLGLLIGSWAPRSEISGLKVELEKTRKLLEDRPQRRRSIGEVTSLLGIDRSSGHAPARATAAAEPDRLPGSSDVAPVQSASGNGENASADSASVTNLDTAVALTNGVAVDPNMGDDIDKAVELWRMRVDVAHSTFVSNTRLDEEQALQFDILVESMNLRIRDTINNFAAELREAAEVQPEAGIRIANEITGAIVQTYDEMDRTMPENWRRRSGKKFSLLDFIDPDVARPLVGVEDKLQHLGGSDD